MTTIGGVEMVTVPASAYAHALRQVAAQELPAETVEQAGPVLDAEGMLALLISLRDQGVVTLGGLMKATGLTADEIEGSVAAYRAMVDGNSAVNAALPSSDHAAPVSFAASPEAARIDVIGGKVEPDAPEAHGAALDDGRSTEAHGAALDAARAERHPRKAKATREVP